MYATTTTFAVQPDHIEQVVAVWSAASEAHLHDVDGFIVAYLLTDQASGRIQTVGIWESEAAARAIADSGQLNHIYDEFLRYAQPIGEGRAGYQVARQITK